MSRQYGDLAIVFNVKDLDRSEAFYRDVVGLKVQRQQDETAGAWLMADVRPGVQLLFFQGEEPVGRSPIVVFGLNEGGIDGVVEALAGAGAQIVTPVAHAPGGWSADFLDPDGHVLSLYQSAERPRRL